MISKVILIVSLTGFIISAIIAFPVFFGGYEYNIIKNRDLSQTSCLISAHTFEKGTCDYLCSCDDEGVCDTCTDVCWRSWYKTQYIVFEPMITRYEFTLYYWHSFVSEQAIKDDINRAHPLNLNTTCYYHRSEIARVVDTKYDEHGTLYAAIAFFAIFGFSTIGLIISVTMCFLERRK